MIFFTSSASGNSKITTDSSLFDILPPISPLLVTISCANFLRVFKISSGEILERSNWCAILLISFDGKLSLESFSNVQNCLLYHLHAKI
jgi:hypothetical protein